MAVKAAAGVKGYHLNERAIQAWVMAVASNARIPPARPKVKLPWPTPILH